MIEKIREMGGLGGLVATIVAAIFTTLYFSGPTPKKEPPENGEVGRETLKVGKNDSDQVMAAAEAVMKEYGIEPKKLVKENQRLRKQLKEQEEKTVEDLIESGRALAEGLKKEIGDLHRVRQQREVAIEEVNSISLRDGFYKEDS